MTLMKGGRFDAYLYNELTEELELLRRQNIVILGGILIE
jgi:hypothetical protein